MRPKILIVDDSASVRMLVKLVLGSDYDFIEAVDGAAGFQKAISERPSLILLDVQMPVMDGITALKHLKSDPATTSIPVLMVSTMVGSEASESVKRGRELGAAGFVAKPITRDALALAVRGFLGPRA